MLLRKWEDLPVEMRTSAVKEYYDILMRKKVSLLAKRIFDIVMSACLLIILSPVMLVIALLIKLDSKGDVFYRQQRVTTYGRLFRIHKFRTMVSDADKIGAQVTVGADPRITKIGRVLRGCRLDEIPQLIDVLKGDMSFVGTRPEVLKYVEEYTDEMKATLLLPAGITSEASIEFKDEAELLNQAEDVDRVYVEEILPQKMVYNLQSLRTFGFFKEMKTMIRTVAAVIR